MKLNILRTSPLFKNIDEKDLEGMLLCLSATSKNYKKDEYIFMQGDILTKVGIVMEGSVNVLQEDFWGNRTILANIVPGNLFAEAFSCVEIDHIPVSAIAAQNSTILFIDYKKIITTCSSSCIFHHALIENMLQIMTQKNILLTNKMEHITRKTTKEKILSFLSAQAIKANSNSFSIPFSRQELADYLAVERSALSKQLSLMKEEGIINYKKNQFEIK